MDKKNLTIGVVLLAAAFGALYVGSRSNPSSTPTPPAREVSKPIAGASTSPGQPLASSASSVGQATSPSDATFAAVVTDDASASITTLGNEFIELRLTNFGGAVRDVAMKKYSAVLHGAERYVFNEVHADPILAFTEDSFPGLSRKTRFEQVSASSTEVVYRAVLENRVEVTRRYTIRAAGDTSGDPYQIRHETTFKNLTGESVILPRGAVNLGTATLVNENDYGQYLNIVSYDGNDTSFTDRGALEGGGLLSNFGVGDRDPKAVLEKTGPVKWASAKNSFFASIVTLDKPGVGVVVRRMQLPPFPGTQKPNIGMTGAIRLDLPTLPANGSTTVGGALYVGPKEYTRLAKFANHEDHVMQYSRGFNRFFLSGYVAPLMNYLMNFTHKLVGNWGLAIVLMTLILKFVTLPLTLAASKSAKRMQKIQPEMQALREKYKDNPQKMQAETMALFKKYGVNPVGGCLPVLATFPLFIGFFAMLQGTAELRFASFLWVQDLSAPDTVLRVFGLPLNIMPLLMGLTMVFQMRLTPQPAVDNAQAKMFKFMPIIFMLFCYNFAAALALYSTINGLFTIGQQMLVNRMKDEPLPTPIPPKGGKGLKNVTPAKGGKR